MADAVEIPLPYYAPRDEMPERLPNWTEAWNMKEAGGRSPSRVQRRVQRRVRGHFLVEFGRDVRFDNAKTMLFLHQTTTAVRVPRVYAMFTRSVSQLGGRVNVIIREWIPGMEVQAYNIQPLVDWALRDRWLHVDTILGRIDPEETDARRRQLTCERDAVVRGEVDRRTAQLADKFCAYIHELHAAVPSPTRGAAAVYEKPYLESPLFVGSVDKWCEDKHRILVHLVERRKTGQDSGLDWARLADAVLCEDGQLVLTSWD
ncbi:hypothetical protein MAPG_10276 [Magnaporthiopsis poae ATCC 64411]|uniref:Uncharacterized protein n=1 Tax=Magnaporthiopsis poae (strain ATCC 64411 / 73-15) TaxID=644358 RepID=A0A0C4EC62_MAGP6|nr:hypothetical protein MAPG_10276 [Magnaporthiopsis poae ATCC 64411]